MLLLYAQEAHNPQASLRSTASQKGGHSPFPSQDQLLAALAAKADLSAVEALQKELEGAKADAAGGLDALWRELGVKPGVEELEGLRRQLADKADRSELEVLMGLKLQVMRLWAHLPNSLLVMGVWLCHSK